MDDVVRPGHDRCFERWRFDRLSGQLSRITFRWPGQQHELRGPAIEGSSTHLRRGAGELEHRAAEFLALPIRHQRILRGRRANRKKLDLDIQRSADSLQVEWRPPGMSVFDRDPRFRCGLIGRDTVPGQRQHQKGAEQSGCRYNARCIAGQRVSWHRQERCSSCHVHGT